MTLTAGLRVRSGVQSLDSCCLLIGAGFTLKDLESVPFGVALPIREAIYRCREQPCSNWSEEVCLLIGRQDLTKQAHKMTLAKSKAVSVTNVAVPETLGRAVSIDKVEAFAFYKPPFICPLCFF